GTGAEPLANALGFRLIRRFTWCTAQLRKRSAHAHQTSLLNRPGDAATASASQRSLNLAWLKRGKPQGQAPQRRRATVAHVKRNDGLSVCRTQRVCDADHRPDMSRSRRDAV